ncbi:hypothetical protein T484DRAFT_1847102 [Baffinella frigidus]|nr:hypothetical protein T484DRAFT_1847102 [Cryptophyta sp. CCMP2293]
MFVMIPVVCISLFFAGLVLLALAILEFLLFRGSTSTLRACNGRWQAEKEEEQHFETVKRSSEACTNEAFLRRNEAFLNRNGAGTPRPEIETLQPQGGLACRYCGVVQ